MFCITLWLCMLYIWVSRGLYLYKPKNTATDFTLVCTWSTDDVEHFQGQPSVRWMFDNSVAFTYNSQLCVLESTGERVNSNDVTIQYGYMYLAVTILDKTSSLRGTWQCSLPPFTEKSNSIPSNFSYLLDVHIQTPVVYPGSNYSVFCATDGRRSTGWAVSNSHTSGIFSLSETCSIGGIALLSPSFTQRLYADCSQARSVTLTLTQVSMDDHETTFRCDHQSTKLIVVDPPDLEQNVTIFERSERENDTSPYILECTTPCESEYNFYWNYSITGNLSEMEYDSCKHTCSQTLTVIDQHFPETQIQCAAANPRTARTSTAQYMLLSQFTTLESTSFTQPSTTTIATTVSNTSTASPRHVINPLLLILIIAGGVTFLVLVVIVSSLLYTGRRQGCKIDRTEDRPEKNAVEGEYLNALHENGDVQNYAEISTDNLDYHYAKIREEEGSSKNHSTLREEQQKSAIQQQRDNFSQDHHSGNAYSDLSQYVDPGDMTYYRRLNVGADNTETRGDNKPTQRFYPKETGLKKEHVGTREQQVSPVQQPQENSTHDHHPGHVYTELSQYLEPGDRTYYRRLHVGVDNTDGRGDNRPTEHYHPRKQQTGPEEQPVGTEEEQVSPGLQPHSTQNHYTGHAYTELSKYMEPGDRTYYCRLHDSTDIPTAGDVNRPTEQHQIGLSEQRGSPIQQHKDITTQDHTHGHAYSDLSHYVEPGDMTYYHVNENRPSGSTPSSEHFYLDLID